MSLAHSVPFEFCHASIHGRGVAFLFTPSTAIPILFWINDAEKSLDRADLTGRQVKLALVMKSFHADVP
jgi:hypothetical protein